jgi:hypothetical protein
MGRIRTIKPEFFRHEGLFAAEQETGLPLRIAFSGLFTVADREGRFVWKPKSIKLDVLPWDDVDFAEVLDALEVRGFIEKYTVNKKDYGVIPTWSKHQYINGRESLSVLPPNPMNKNKKKTSTRAARVADTSRTPHGNARGEGEGEREENGGGDEPLTKIDDSASERLVAKAQTLRERLLLAVGVDPISGLTGHGSRVLGTQADMAEVAKWFAEGLTEAEILAEVSSVMNAKRDGPPSSFRYFHGAIARLVAAKRSGPLNIPTNNRITKPKGKRHDERDFHQAVFAVADGLSAGTVHLAAVGRDPFAD